MGSLGSPHGTEECPRLAGDVRLYLVSKPSADELCRPYGAQPIEV